MKTKIKKIYKEKGLNGVHNFLKKNNIPYTQKIIDFGLSSNKKAKELKKIFLEEETPENILQTHYFSRGVKSRKTGYSYNILRGSIIEIN